MPPVTAKGQADGSTTASFVIPQTGLDVEAVYVTIDATAAAADVTAELTVSDQSGAVIARKVQTEAVTVGTTGSATWALRLLDDGGAVVPPFSLTYPQVIAAYKSSYTCVAEWQLDDGASPYADTSGYSLADPATMTRQITGTAMSQALASGPLASAPAGPSVRFNFDGTAATGTGDYLTDAVATPARYYFLGNLPFTVVAWVLPSVPVNAHRGPVVGTVHVTSFGAPNAHDDGWDINVQAPSNVCSVQRFSNVQTGQNPDAVSLGTLSTTQWSMVAMTYDGATLRGYLNGALSGSVASAGAIGGAPNNAFIAENSVPLGGAAQWYFGAASQISVWAATFTATDIATLYLSAFN